VIDVLAVAVHRTIAGRAAVHVAVSFDLCLAASVGVGLTVDLATGASLGLAGALTRCLALGLTGGGWRLAGAACVALRGKGGFAGGRALRLVGSRGALSLALRVRFEVAVRFTIELRRVDFALADAVRLAASAALDRSAGRTLAVAGHLQLGGAGRLDADRRAVRSALDPSFDLAVALRLDVDVPTSSQTRVSRRRSQQAQTRD